MDKEAILEYLYGLQMFGIKLGLENIRSLLASVDNPQQKCRIVHVAGTNGKGSVCAFLRTILTQAGYRVGTYTSPHLHQFNERISINDRPIADAELVPLVEELRQLNSDIPATFFEFTTALALLYFARMEVDIVLLEVGMGGRLDATNVVTALVSVITPISADHGDYLGSTLEQIAAEKGGIIKGDIPVVVADQPEEVLHTLEHIAAQRGTRLWCYGRDFYCSAMADAIDVVTGERNWSALQPSLPGEHQHYNLATALMVLQILQLQYSMCCNVTLQQVRDAVTQVRWPGRLEWWPQARPTVLLDGAHNESGAQALAAYLQRSGYADIRWVAGFKADKDVSAIVSPLLGATQKVYLAPPPVEQPFPCEQVAAEVKAAAVAVQCYPDAACALRAAMSDCNESEIVVVAGSLFLVAACRAYLCAACPPVSGREQVG